MATQSKHELAELAAVIEECKDKNVDELIVQAGTRLRLLRDVKKMIGNPPAKRTKTKEETPVAGSVGSKAS